MGRCRTTKRQSKLTPRWEPLSAGWQPHLRAKRRLSRSDSPTAGCLRHDPQQVATRVMLANLLERSGELEAAKSELQRVLDSKARSMAGRLSARPTASAGR